MLSLPILPQVSGFVLLIYIASFIRVQGQSIQFSSVPETINEGAKIIVSWTGGDGVTPITVDLVQDGRFIDDVYGDDGDDGFISSSFEWDVDLGDNFGGYYSLRLVQGTQTVESGPINIIDEAGRGATAPPPSATTSTETSAISTSATTTVMSVTDTLTTTGATGSRAQTPTSSGTAAGVTGTSQAGNSTEAPLQNTGGNSNGGLSGGAIAGIVIGILAALALAGVVTWLLWRRSRQRRVLYRPASTGFMSSDGKAPGDHNGTFSTTAAFAATVNPDSGETRWTAPLGEPAGYQKAELDGAERPVRPESSVYGTQSPELPGPDYHELNSPDVSIQNSNRGARGWVGTGGSDTYRTVAGDSSVSELIGSPGGLSAPRNSNSARVL